MLVLVIAKRGAPHLKVLETLPKEAEVKVGETGADFIAEDLARAEVVVNGSHHGHILEEIWPSLKNLKWVHSLSAGVEGVVIPALKESSVPLTNARGVYKKSLGEWAVLAMLYFAKDVRRLERQKSESRWEQFDVDMLSGATVAIIGYGEIGREVAWRAKAFGMNVIATRRRVTHNSDEYASEILPSSENIQAIEKADYVVLSSALTPETRGMIGTKEFAAMKPTAVFINIGRGAVVDEPAMVDALQNGKIRGAGLDVFIEEPLPADSPLWKLDNVLLSPHSADHTATWQHETVEFFVENFNRYIKGEQLENIVDKQAGY